MMAAHATIINEYGWLWLRRDGEPTLLTEKLYESCSGPGTRRSSARAVGLPARRERRILARAPQLRGILHFVYLTCSYPGVFTADHFRDVTSLELDPWFADYMGEAMKRSACSSTSSSRGSRRGPTAPTA